MCGIFCLMTINKSDSKESVNEVEKCLRCTYEKCMGNIYNRGPDSQSTVFTTIKNWHLLLSSSVLWLQGSNLVKQPVETEKSLFLYNGDIFDSDIIPSNTRNTEGDTKLLLDTIEKFGCTPSIFQKISGPYAFIYLDKSTSKLYFARDKFGRRSLLIGKDNNRLLLSSVTSRTINIPTIEMPALGIFCIDLNEDINSISLYPWQSDNQHFEEKLSILQTFLSTEITIEGSFCNDKLLFEDPPESEISIFKNIETLQMPEVFNYCFENNRWQNNILKLNSILEAAVEKRIANQPRFCMNCINNKITCDHALVGVLFSGGVDCAIISLIADKFIDKHRPIDILNVAFEKNGSYESPDRCTAKQTLEELRKLRPERVWNLMEINVTVKELCKERSERIADLIYPLQSILDESLGCALWFASRGRTDVYNTACRVLFVGMGADELFGGYTRHRAAYKRGGWQELTKELDNDWKNISHRNLARDDRVVADHGRQLRTPYLDETFVDFVRNLNAWERCCPSEKISQGVGDKLLLRMLAYHLGLKQTSILRKRALQFGSRIANSKEKAHEISPRLL